METGALLPVDLTDPAVPSSGQTLILKAAEKDGGLETEADHFRSSLTTIDGGCDEVYPVPTGADPPRPSAQIARHRTTSMTAIPYDLVRRNS